MKDHGRGAVAGYRAVLWTMIPGLLFLVFYTLGRPLALDDTHSTFHAYDGVFGVVEKLRTDSHPPLYFWFLAVWMDLAGMGEVALRAPSVVFLLAAGLALWSFGRRFVDARVGILFAVLFLFNPAVVQHFHTVRPYALAGLLSALSTIAYLDLSWDRHPERRAPWWAYVTANVLGTFTHYWFFLLLAGQGAGALLVLRGRRLRSVIVALAVSAIPFALLWTPVLIGQTGGAPTSWMPTPSGLWLLGTPIQLVGGNEGRALVFYLVFLAACLLRTGPDDRTVSWSETKGLLRDRRTWQLAAIPVTVFVLAFVVSQFQPVYHIRYIIVALPAFAVLLGLVVDQLADRRLAPLVPLVAVLGSVAIRNQALSFELARDHRAVTQSLIDQHEEGDALLHVALNYAPTLHYLRALAPGQSFSQTVFPAEVARHPGWRNTQAGADAAAELGSEATEVVRRLASRPGRARVWLLADQRDDSVLTRLLIDELESELGLVRAEDAPGWRVTELRLYESVASSEAGGLGGHLAQPPTYTSPR